MQAGEGVAVARAIAEPGGDQGRRQHRLFQRVTGPGRIGDQEHRAVGIGEPQPGMARSMSGQVDQQHAAIAEQVARRREAVQRRRHRARQRQRLESRETVRDIGQQRGQVAIGGGLDPVALLQVRLRPVPRQLALAAAGIAETLARLRPGQPEPRLTRYGVGVIGWSQTLDIGRARDELGYQPQVTLEQGLADFARSWRQ